MSPLAIKQTIDPSSVHVEFNARRRKREQGERVYPERIRRVQFQDTSRKTSNRLMIAIDNSDGLLFGDDLLMRKGTLIQFSFGNPNAIRNAGDFVIKKRKPQGKNLVLECHEAKRNRHSRKPNTRSWGPAKRSDVVRHLLSRMGFSGNTAEVDESDLVLPIITQHKTGDYQFIEKLAEAEEKEFWIDESGAHWVEPRRNQKPSNRYRYKQGLIGVGKVAGDPTIEDFGLAAPGRIRARGIDPVTGEEFVVSASDSTDPNEQIRGLIKLAETDTFMTPEEGDQDASGNDGSEIEVTTGARSKEEAKLEVDSLYKKYRYGALKVRIPLFGDPFLFPRSIAEVWGLGPAIDGYFWVKEVNHEISSRSMFLTTVELNKDGLNKKNKVKPTQQSTYDQEGFLEERL